MNKTELKVIADLIYKNLTKGKSKAITYSAVKIRNANDAIAENNNLRNKSLDNNLELIIPKIDAKILANIEKIRDILKSFEEALGKKKEYLTINGILEELIVLNKKFKSLEFVDNTLSVTTEKIVLEHLDLGRFKINLHINNIHESPNNFVRIHPLEPNYAHGGETYSHPHVSGSKLCIGEGYHILCDAAQQGRIEDIYNIIMSILNTYNEDSAYVGLDEWDGQVCGRCDEFYDSEESGCCCEICDRGICDDCSSYCECCERSVCNSHMETYCDVCDKRACSGCVENSRCCEVCDKVLCESCQSICDQSDTTICEDCSSCCDSCGHTISKKYVLECAKCSASICEDCKNECKCGKTICEDCHDNEKWCCPESESESTTTARRRRTNAS